MAATALHISNQIKGQSYQRNTHTHRHPHTPTHTHIHTYTHYLSLLPLYTLSLSIHFSKAKQFSNTILRSSIDSNFFAAALNCGPFFSFSLYSFSLSVFFSFYFFCFSLLLFSKLFIPLKYFFIISCLSSFTLFLFSIEITYFVTFL